MELKSLKYQNRIVVFLDVLGFKNMLYQFEEEAIKNRKSRTKMLISQKATDFVNVFKEVTSMMDKFECNYYLFSDNICLTVDPYYKKSLTSDILFTISTLFKKFSEMGYFLRGGIDYGLMLDEESIALGVPLANAYILESEKAVFPRVVISDRFHNFLKDTNFDEHTLFNIKNFVNNNCEINYINPFYNVIKTDDKVAFFQEYKNVIEEHMYQNKNIENIYLKYEWLAYEYNSFLDTYLEQIEYFEQDFEIHEEEIDKLKTLKI